VSSRSLRGLPVRRLWAGAALGAGGLPLLTAVLVAHRQELSYATPVLLTLLLVVAVALVGGLRPAGPAAVGGGLLLNYFFTPPIHQLTVQRPQDLLVLGVYLAVAVAVSAVVDVAARRTVEAARAAAEAQALSSVAGSTLGEQATLPGLLQQVRSAFDASYVAMLHTADGQTLPYASVGEPAPGDAEQLVPAGAGATLVVRGPQLFAQDRRVLAAFAEAAATALEGRRLADRPRRPRPSIVSGRRCSQPSGTTSAPPWPARKRLSHRCGRPMSAGPPRRSKSSWRRSRTPPTGSRAWSATCSTPPACRRAPSRSGPS